MDAFERFVAVALEADGFRLFEDVRLCAREATEEDPECWSSLDGCRVGIVAARADCLVLAMVRSMFGSCGVVAEHVTGAAREPSCRKRYELLNDPAVRESVLADAAERFGYDTDEIVLRLYVAKFATRGHGRHEERVREWCARQHAGAGPIEVVGVREVMSKVRKAAQDAHHPDPVLKTLELLDASGFLAPEPQPVA